MGSEPAPGEMRDQSRSTRTMHRTAPAPVSCARGLVGDRRRHAMQSATELDGVLVAPSPRGPTRPPAPAAAAMAALLVPAAALLEPPTGTRARERVLLARERPPSTHPAWTLVRGLLRVRRLGLRRARSRVARRRRLIAPPSKSRNEVSSPSPSSSPATGTKLRWRGLRVRRLLVGGVVLVRVPVVALLESTASSSSPAAKVVLLIAPSVSLVLVTSSSSSIALRVRFESRHEKVVLCRRFVSTVLARHRDDEPSSSLPPPVVALSLPSWNRSPRSSAAPPGRPRLQKRVV